MSTGTDTSKAADEQWAFYLHLIDLSKLYFTIVSALLVAVLFKVNSLPKRPLGTGTVASRVSSGLFIGSAILLFVATGVLVFSFTRLGDYVYNFDPRTGQFCDVARDNNSGNNRRVGWLAIAAYSTLAGLALAALGFAFGMA